MNGVKIEITTRGVVNARRVLDRLSHFDTRDLLDNIGAVVETQTRRRLSEEKTDPEGQPWEPLSERYAAWKEKHSSGGILELEGDLIGSITHKPSHDAVQIGSNVLYSTAHQLGTEDIPERPYLGLSDDNADEVEEAVTTWLREVMGI